MARFSAGQIVEHQKFGYRGVIFAVDEVFALTDEWYDNVARSRPPRDRPWYHVLVDGADHTTYVAQRHLEPSQDCSQIEHPLLGEWFDRYDGQRYRPRAGG
ncbi:MAG: heat shock protein HspQ [Gammaproteobacteria bacterium]|nr:heat shock protein HspQ [Gammaproteobacteria bacterium]